MTSSRHKSLRNSSLSGKCVLITRPANFEDYLVQQIELRGGSSIQLPSIEINFVAEKSEIEHLVNSDCGRRMVIFTSRNAVAATAHCMTSINLQWPQYLQCAAVGPKTAESIRKTFGVSDVLSPRSKFGVEGLMEMDEMQNLAGIPTTIIDGGGEGSKKLSELLRQKGSPSIEHLVVYQRILPDADVQSVADCMKGRPVDFTVITSVAGASNLFELIGAKLTEKLKLSCMVAYSDRIAEYLKQQGFDQIVIPSESSDDAVVEAIEQETV